MNYISPLLYLVDTQNYIKLFKKNLIILFFTAFLTSAQSADHLIAQGRIALQQKKKEMAYTAFKQAVEHYPTRSDVQFYMGIFHYYSNEGNHALSFLKRSYELNPENAQYLNAYATVATYMGQFDLARDIIELHYGAEPRDATLRTKLLPIYIRNKDWYYALKLCNISDLWWYNEDITHQSILLDLSSSSNDHGDIIHIVRYAKHLNAAGAHVTVYVCPELVPLLSLCPYIEQVISTTHPKPTVAKEYKLTVDRFILATHATAHTQSQDIPYIFADETICNKWKTRLSTYNTFKVGICFQGSKVPDYFSNTFQPGPRSMHGDQIVPLLNCPGVSFFSLHSDHELDAKKLCRYNTFHVFDDLNATHSAYMESVALIKQLDLIITVDTTIAHLAGAVGVPVWVMMPYATDFRWLGADENCPWYPTMTFFKQTEHGNWDPVIKSVKDKLIIITSTPHN